MHVCGICMLHLICWDGCTEQLESQPSCSSSAGIEHADQQNNLLARASCGHKLLDNEQQHATKCVALWMKVQAGGHRCHHSLTKTVFKSIEL